MLLFSLGKIEGRTLLRKEGRSLKVFEKRYKMVIQEGKGKCNVITQCCVNNLISMVLNLKWVVSVFLLKSGSVGIGSLKGMSGFPQYGVWSGNYTWRSSGCLWMNFSDRRDVGYPWVGGNKDIKNTTMGMRARSKRHSCNLTTMTAFFKCNFQPSYKKHFILLFC